MKKTIREFESTEGYKPNSKQLSENLNLSEKKIEELLSYDIKMVDSIKFDSDDDSINETHFIDRENANPEETHFKEIEKADVLILFNCLTKNEKLVLEYKYGFIGEKTYKDDEVSKLMNISKNRVRNLEKQAFKKLKERYNNGTRDSFRF